MTLYVHAGMSKTGTTSLQQTLAASRDVLRAAGYGYATLDEGPDFNHHGMVYATQRSRAALDALLDKAYAGPATPHTIVSSEVLQLLSAGEKKTLVAALTARFGKPRVIVYLRHPVDWSNSQSQQAIKMRKRTYEEVCTQPPLPAYRAILGDWEKVSGRGAMTVKVFSREALAGGDVVDDFLGEIGAANVLPTIARVRANESITMPAARALSEVMKLERKRKTPLKLALGPIIAMSGPKFALPDWSVGQLQALARPDLEWLAETWGIAFDNAPRWQPEPDAMAETFARMLAGLEGTLAHRNAEIEALREGRPVPARS